SYSPEKRSAVRSRSKSRSSAAAVRSSSAVSSASPDSSTSSSVATRSSTRPSNPRQSSISERRPSASRRTFWAARWSSQNPGSVVSASSWATRRSLASRSKTPRGRPDPLGQVANGGRVHLVPRLEVLQQDRAELDEAKGRLAPGDDGVHAGTVRVVGADAAVAVTVESCRVAARPAVSLAGDEIDERRFLGLLQTHPSLCAWQDWGVGARGPAPGIPPIPSPRELPAVSHVESRRPRGTNRKFRPPGSSSWPSGCLSRDKVLRQSAQLVDRGID